MALPPLVRKRRELDQRNADGPARMTSQRHITKFPDARAIAAQAKLFAEIAADCSRGILPGDYSQAGIAAFAAEVEEIFWEMRLAKADRQSQIEQPPAVVERKPRRPSISKTIEQAEKATGKTVASITMPDGTTLRFGEIEPTEATNPWLVDLDKVKQQ
jgi:hypothetical protein